MTFLAAVEGNLIFFLIAGVIGLIKWLSQKNETPDAGSPGGPPSPQSPVRSGGGSEEERMRKFLEALGVPADQRPPPPIQRRVTPSAPPTLPNIQPRGPVVAEPVFPSYTKKRKASRKSVPPTLPPRPAYAEPPPVVETAAEKFHFRELQTNLVPEFQTESSHVTAIPFEASHADMRDAYKTVSELPLERPAGNIRELLQSRGSLRNAVLLREILGPPRGLPSSGTFPTF